MTVPGIVDQASISFQEVQMCMISSLGPRFTETLIKAGIVTQSFTPFCK